MILYKPRFCYDTHCHDDNLCPLLNRMLCVDTIFEDGKS